MADTNSTKTKEEIQDDAKRQQKSENDAAKLKQKAEGDAATWVSPEKKALDGGDNYVNVKTVPSKPDPSVDEALLAETRARDQKNASKP